MHKGLQYPWHWRYWATECFFFPGYVPWQMIWNVGPGMHLPWSVLYPIPPVTSSEGATVPDATQISYQWEIPFGLLLGFLQVSIEQESFYGDTYAVWKAILYNGFIDVGAAYFFQQGPQYHPEIVIQPWWTAHDPHGLRDGPILGFRASHWNEISTQPHS